MLVTALCLLVSGVSPVPWGEALYTCTRAPTACAPSDTTTAVEPPVLLTVEQLTRYLAVAKELTTFWQTHPWLLRASRARYTFPIQNPMKRDAGAQTIWVPDVAAVAAREPGVAAIFRHHTFPPAQFVPTTIAMRQALATAALGEVMSVGTWVMDSASTWAKNVAFVRAHRQALAGAGVDFEW